MQPGELAIPQDHTVTSLADEPGCEDDVAIDALEPGTTISIHTAFSEYQLRLLDAATRSVLVHGGDVFPEETLAMVLGASDGRTIVKAGWIAPGLRLALCASERRVITSRVRSIVCVAPSCRSVTS